MKIVCIDNFDREHVSEVLVAENVPEHYADRIVDALNALNATNDKQAHSEFFVTRADDRALYVFDPNGPPPRVKGHRV